MQLAFFFTFALVLSACRPSPFKVQTLPPAKLTKVEKIQELAALNEQEKLALSARYKSLNQPSLGIIMGDYRLPKAKPYGSVKINRTYSYWSALEELSIKENPDNFAITPWNGEKAQSLNKAINALLDLGVKIKEISFQEALNIAQAENAAHKQQKSLLWSQKILPGVDLLLSLQEAHSENGPLLLGRVISKKADLLAFRVIYRYHAKQDLTDFLISLFKDSIERLK